MIKKITLLCILCAISFNFAFGQLVQYHFTSSPILEPSSFDANIIASDISLSTGTVLGSSVGTYLPDEPYIEGSSGWGKIVESEGKYFSASLSTTPGYQLSITNFALHAYATTAGPSVISIFINDVLYYTGNITDDLLVINALISGQTELLNATIKIVGWDNGSRNTSGGGSFKIDSLVVEGSTSLIPPKDQSSSIQLTSYEIPDQISSLQAFTVPIKALEFSVVDSATTDSKATQIDSLIFTQDLNIDNYLLSSYLSKAALVDLISLDTIWSEISDTSIKFSNSASLTVPNGVAQKKTFELLLWIRGNSELIDGKSVILSLNHEKVYCSALGSNVAYGSLSSGSNKLLTEVIASQIIMPTIPDRVWKDSSFSMVLYATDSFGNVDSHYSSDLQINSSADYGLLSKPENAAFLQGSFTSSEYSYSASDTFLLTFSTESLPTINKSIIATKPIFAPDFESYPLSNWQNSEDWKLDNQSIIHKLADTSATSFISHSYDPFNLNAEKTIWRLQLQNGDFDPTSSNRFWYYLMASENDLVSDAQYGYVVGVNFSGSNDSLSLWRLDENGSKNLILQSTLDWDESTCGRIEVNRTNSGHWQLAWDTISNFQSMNYSDQYLDTTYTHTQFHGLVFQYSSTRAGKLSLSDLTCYTINQGPYLKNAIPIHQDTILLTFSEDLNQDYLIHSTQFQLLNSQKEQIEIQSITTHKEFPNQLHLNCETLTTDSYKISCNDLQDRYGHKSLYDTKNFTYEVPAQLHDLVINEILFDNSPMVTLPEYDYLELYNRSNLPFRLLGWNLKIGNYTRELADTTILPDQYIIVTSSNALELYQPYGTSIVGIGSTYLTNTGKSIELFNQYQQMIDSVSYASDWMKNELKQDGGWALERKDVNNFCVMENNWAASIDTLGGTPGTQNSISEQIIDSTAPQIIYSELLNDSALIFELSEPVILDQISDITISTQNENLASVIYSTTPSSLSLLLDSPLSFNQEINIRINGLRDLCGNNIIDTTISLKYNFIEKYDIVINEVFADPSPPIGLPEYEYLELFNNSSKTLNLKNWILSINQSSIEIPTFILKPNAYLILCETNADSMYSTFGTTLGISNFPSITNDSCYISIRDTSAHMINEFIYLKSYHSNSDVAQGGYSLERIDPDNSCGNQNWKSSEDVQGGSPGLKNSVWNRNSDQKAPQINQVLTMGSNKLWLALSEPVEESSLNTKNFILNEIHKPKIVSLTEEGFVELTFENSFKNGSQLSLVVSNLTDACQNINPSQELLINHYKPDFGDVLFSEIMYNPESGLGLPDKEYIEVYNTSSYAISTMQWSLLYKNKAYPIIGDTILAQSYIILCALDDAEAFEPYGKVISLPNFPSLPLNGAVALFDELGIPIAQLTYSNDWVREELKSEGAYSLERVDVNNPVNNFNNWKESVNTIGGTPGTANSVTASNPDERAPNLLYAFPEDKQTLILTFDESIQSNSLSLSDIWFEPSEIIPTHVEWLDHNYTSLKIAISEDFKLGSVYEVFIKESVSDLSENLIAKQSISFQLPEQIEPQSILINEVLFDAPEWGSEFIEIYNHSNKAYNLQNLRLTSRDDDGNLKSTLSITNEGKLILPQQFMVLSKDFEKVQESYQVEHPYAYINTDEFPSLSNSKGNIVLVDTLHRVIDELSYTDKLHFDLLEELSGVSLERINYDWSSNDESNWHSASQLVGWATPTYQNSVYTPAQGLESEITIEPEGFSPDNDGYEDFLNINYSFKESGFIANAFIINKHGYNIKTLANNELIGLKGHWLWDGVADSGQKAAVGIYIIYIKVFNLTGEQKQFKRVCVVNAKFE